MMKLTIVLLSSSYCFCFNILTAQGISLSNSYSPQPGDLLFQDLDCVELCDAITSVTFGYENTQVSHVGMVVFVSKENTGEAKIIEAFGTNVHLTKLHDFLSRSLDENAKPRVMVGRINPSLQHLIPTALRRSLTWLGLPYNSGFTFDNKFKSFYCSQLIYDAFLPSSSASSWPSLSLSPDSKSESQSFFVPLWHKRSLDSFEKERNRKELQQTVIKEGRSVTSKNDYQKIFERLQLQESKQQIERVPLIIFDLNIMTFKRNGNFTPAWISYFALIHKEIPEGDYGTNPGMMSRSKNLKIIYHFGKLRSIVTNQRKGATY